MPSFPFIMVLKFKSESHKFAEMKKFRSLIEIETKENLYRDVKNLGSRKASFLNTRFDLCLPKESKRELFLFSLNKLKMKKTIF